MSNDLEDVVRASENKASVLHSIIIDFQYHLHSQVHLRLLV
jgi:hypothetical protein